MLQGRAICRVLLMLLLPATASSAALVAPYVNTVHEDVALMLDLAEVTAEDYLIDLGSGDGRIVIAAALRGAPAHGVELQPELVALAETAAREAGVADRVHFVEGDIFAADLSRASVVTAYLFPEANLQLRPKLLAELPPGTRVISNAFDMGDWLPDKREYGRTSGGAMLWVIPARISGGWILNVDGRQLTLQIEQRFQQIAVAMQESDRPVPIARASLRGNGIEFSTDGPEKMTFTGRVDGSRMSGRAAIRTREGFKAAEWQALRND